MENFVIIAVIAAIVGFAVYYILKEKKRGVKCIGCSESCNCSKGCGNCNGCGGAKSN